MKRRDLLVKLSALPFMAVPISYLVSACSGNSYSNNTAAAVTGNCVSNGATTSVGAPFEGHLSTIIPSSDIVTATQQQYTVPAGDAGHTHTFTVEATHFATLKSNYAVTLATNADGTGHTHSITISCS